MRYLRYGFLAVVVLLLVSACSDTPKEGPVTIVAQDNFSTRPVVGTFEVTEGADVLGCSSGTFVDEFIAGDDIRRVFSCDSGSNEGAFAASFDLNGTATGEGDDGGAWSVLEGSDDFVGLQGAGEWFVVYATGEITGVSTWTGDIDYNS